MSDVDETESLHRAGIDRLARFVCEECGRDWRQYTHENKEVPCIRCRSGNIEERTKRREVA